MRYTPSNHQTKGTLIDYFKETHDYRRNVIKTNNLSITNIVEECSRFKDMAELVRFRSNRFYMVSYILYHGQFSCRCMDDVTTFTCRDYRKPNYRKTILFRPSKKN